MGYFTRELLERLAPPSQVQPKHMDTWKFYVDGFMRADHLFEKYKFTTRNRLCHGMAQWIFECGDYGPLSALWENMDYSAARIMEIFGEGRHSAGIREGEARRLSHNAFQLAERVYGVGNPSKMREFENFAPGDGFNYRGFGPQQLTGAKDHKRICTKMGCTVEQFHTDPLRVIESAMIEWTEKSLHQFADKDDIHTITRRINGGYNGLSDRIALLGKVRRIILTDPHWEPQPELDRTAQNAQPPIVVNTGTPVASPAKEADDMSARSSAAQKRLADLGYNLGTADGNPDAMVTAAILSFQHVNGIPLTGTLDDTTLLTVMCDDAKPFPVPLERQDISKDDLRKAGSRTMQAAASVKSFVAWLWASITGLFIDEVSGTGYIDSAIKLLDKTNDLKDKAGLKGVSIQAPTTQPVSPTHVKLYLLVALVAVASFVMWRYAASSENRRVDEARSGDNRSK